jgi:hypothetical protein
LVSRSKKLAVLRVASKVPPVREWSSHPVKRSVLGPGREAVR